MYNQKTNLKRTGFTLIEIVLTLAIITTVAMVSMPIYGRLKSTSDLDTSVALIVQTIRRAQTLSMGVEHDSSWGIILEPSVMTLYALDTNGSRLPDYDETTPLPETITFTGQTTIVFTKLTGEPVIAGTITLTNPNNNVSKTITISETGVASF